MWSVGRLKVTFSDEFAEAAILLVLSRFDRVRWAMGCMIDGVMGTLGSVACTLGSDASTLGGGSSGWRFGGRVLGVDMMLTSGSGAWWLGGRGLGFGLLKIALRLSTARSCALQLSFVLSALTAMVSARRQWMILSVVVRVGTDRVGCWKTTVSEMMTAEVAILMILWHL